MQFKISYTLSAPDSVTFTLERKTSGRMVNGKCVTPTSKNKKHSGCTTLTAVRGSIDQTGKAGANSFTFTGRIAGHRLQPGTYRLTATPAGGRPEHVSFAILA